MVLNTVHIKSGNDWRTIDCIQNVKNNLITYFIDTTGSSTTWQYNNDVLYNISSTSIPNSLTTFIEESIASLDQILDINFQRVYNSTDATLKIIHTDMAEIPGMGTSSGAASQTYPNEYYDYNLDKWRANDVSLEVIIKDDWFYTSQGIYNYFQEHLVLHEIGHVLTLEHPFEDADGDVYGTMYGENAVTVSETQMAYENNDLAYTKSYSSLDIKALKEIWGENFAPTNCFL